MKLREHPLMSYRGLKSWPPVWISRTGRKQKEARGEVGILREVFLSPIGPRYQICLIVEHEGSEYMGALLISDHSFYQQIFEVLSKQYGSRIADIGGLDLSDLD